jgi:hypothetical protein
LLLAAEVCARLAWTARACYKDTCDFSKLLNLKIYDGIAILGFTEKNIGLSAYDDFLGYIPKAGFTNRINANG